MSKLYYLKAEAVCGNITPQKPHKWGYKVWVLCGVSGYAYDFEVYTGRQNNLLMNDEEDCGASGNSKFTDDIGVTRVLPVSNVQRYSQAEKKIVMVPRPLATGEYNKYMCGTDRTVPYLC